MNSLRDPYRRPTHPGAILREDVLPALALSPVEFAERIGVSQRTMAEVLHEKSPLTPDMAYRLAVFLRTTPSSWLGMQEAWDNWAG
ncbi:HigA family addiction module antidote protein [Pseudoduganella sp. FT55W]|uniref:HigA family addiction module antidote protein n=1 Tax=Duganella rivi TaxID=2666083 RepID=A0A7X4GVS1_9BURK|nr:HigA family addiction module antidote protein [Duganella rivi]